MEWYNILSIVVGALGGTAGFISIYHAKSNKDTIDLGNMRTMLEEAQNMYKNIKEEKKASQEEFNEYKNKVHDRFQKLEERLSKNEKKVFQLKSAIYQGYRCKFPAEIGDCPVIKEYEKNNCEDCDIQTNN